MKKRNLRIASGVLAMALLVSTNVFATTTAEYDAQVSDIKEKQAQNEAAAEELNVPKRRTRRRIRRRWSRRLRIIRRASIWPASASMS